MTIRIDMTEARMLGPALPTMDLFKLQTWFSPSFPVGSFGYSHGLEWVIEAGDVTDATAVGEWIEGVLRHGAGRSDAIILGAIWRAVSSQDWNAAEEIAELAAALQPSAERRLESLGQGAAFLSAAAAVWPHPVLEHFRESCPGAPAFPTAIGIASAAHGLPLEHVLVAYLHAFAANLVSAGIRLVPLGQTDGLKILARLEGSVLDVAREALLAGVEDLGSAAILADIASMRHETQYTRLFRS